MTPIFITYFVGALAILGTLAAMILRVGTAVGACPNKGPGVRAAAIAISTGFAAIGAGAVTLIAAALPVLGGDLVALFLCLGFATFALGLGFSNAVAVLRNVTDPRQPKNDPPSAARA